MPPRTRFWVTYIAKMHYVDTLAVTTAMGQNVSWQYRLRLCRPKFTEFWENVGTYKNNQ